MTGESVSWAAIHDRLDLLHVVHVEGGQAVVVLGGVVQQDAHGYQCHIRSPYVGEKPREPTRGFPDAQAYRSLGVSPKAASPPDAGSRAPTAALVPTGQNG
jgi:hypothetical protein